MEINPETARKIVESFKGYVARITAEEVPGGWFQVCISNLVLLAAMDVLIPITPEASANLAEHCQYVMKNYHNLENGFENFQEMMKRKSQ